MAIRNRPDHDGKHRLAFERNKKKIMLSQSICGICGKPVDKSIRYPNPMAGCIDHIIPIDKGGHPSDISNLQLAHWICNRQKSNKIKAPIADQEKAEKVVVGNNRLLPLSMDWKSYKGTK